MKKEILEYLKNSKSAFISGEELSVKLKVSRTAIWKHINSLKDEGYIIESQSKLGYRLVDVPNTLNPRELLPILTTKFIGRVVKYFDEVDSTNQVARSIANSAEEGTIVLAETQTKGKGRLGRAWISPKGAGIWVSVILKPQINPSEAPRVTSLAALALVKAIEEETSIEVGIKWPNDIVYSGKKAAGVLTEMSAELDKINYIILGVGINVNLEVEDFPVELRGRATSLKEILDQKVSRKGLLTKFLKHLEDCYEHLVQGEFDQVIKEVKRFSITIGSKVKVTSLNQAWEGKVIDIDQEGALVLQTEKGTVERILSGDISIRNSDGSYSG